MKVGIMAWGSEGDIRPLVALAQGLSDRGHEVDLVISPIDYRDYSGMLEGRPVRLSLTAPIPHDRELADRMSAMAISKRDPVEHFRFLLDHLFDPVEQELLDHSVRLCRDCDVVVKHLLVHTLSVAAEKHGTPLVDVTPTAGALRSPDIRFMGAPWLGRPLNALLWRIASKVLSRLLGERINSLRKQVGLDPIPNVYDWLITMSDLTLVGCSRAFFPREVRWGMNARLCGSMVPEQPETGIPPALQSFLEAGEAPVYCTFGSMMHFEPEPDRLMELVSRAILDAGQRGVIQCGRQDLRWMPSSDDIVLVGRTPHREVFPHCRAVLHHGGAGTTHTVTGCGLPSVVLMYGVDQLFWGPLLHGRGVAPKPLLRRKLSLPALTGAIAEACGSDGMRARARELAGVMAGEDGLDTAVRLIEGLPR
ncbi:glycosyltransferase family 1 protein [Candidatus Fermentibacterales bacterium]|nr:glycosyltransferase family 1 protein [Candidatus Fermentibacterales bacterium]